MARPTVIGGDEARTLIDTFDTIPPEEQGNRLQQLRDYQAQQVQIENDTRRNTVENLFTDIDTLGGTFDQSIQIGEWTNDDKAAAASRQWVAMQTGKTPEEIQYTYPMLRDRIARDSFNVDGVNDAAFYGLVKKSIDTRKLQETEISRFQGELVTTALNDALSGTQTPVWQSYNQWKESLPPEFGSTGTDGEALRQAWTMSNKIRSDIEQFKGPAADVWETLTKFTKGEQDDNDVLTIATQLGNMPEEEVEKILGYAVLAARSQNPENPDEPLADLAKYAENMGTSVSRSFNFIPKATLAAQETQFLNAISLLESGDAVMSGNLATLGNLVPRPKKGDLGNAEVGEQYRRLTKEETATLLAEAKAALPAFQIARKFKQAADSEFDPIERVYDGWTSTIFEGGGYGLAGSAGFMAATALNPALGGAVMFADEYDRIRVDYPNMAPETASHLALGSAAIQTGLEVLQLESLKGSLPLFADLVGGLKSNRRKIVGGILANVAEQNIQEGLQDFTPIVFDQMANAISPEDKKKDFIEAMGEWKDSRLDVFFAVLPLGLIGGGLAGAKDFKANVEKVVTDPVLLPNVGLNPKQVDYVRSGSTLSEKVENFAEVYPFRNRALEKEHSKSIEAYIRRGKDANDDPNTPTKKLTYDQEQTPVWEVQFPDGQTFTANDEQAADIAILDYSEQQEKQSQDAFAAFVQHFEQRGGDGVKFDVTGISKTMRDALDRGESPIEVLRERMKLAGLPDAMALDEVFITGETSVQKLADDLYQATVKLYEGANPLTVVEEYSHAWVKTALAEGRVTSDQLNSWVKDYEQASGETLLTGSKQGTIEAISRLGEAYFAGRAQADAIPSPLLRFFNQIREFFKEAFIRAAKLEQAIKEGKVSKDFEAFLAESVGISPEMQVDRTTQKATGEIFEGTSFSITTKENIESLEKRIEEISKSPDERLRVLEEGNKRLSKLVRESADMVQRLRDQASNVGNLEASLEQLEAERAATLADLDIDEAAEIEESGSEVVEQFAQRIEESPNESTRKSLEREAKARAVEKRKGIESKYNEKRKAANEKYATEVRRTKQEQDKAISEEAQERSRELKETKTLNAIGQFEALLKALPPEVRGRVGGFRQLVQITGEKAFANFFLKRIDMIERAFETTLKQEYDEKLKKLFNRAKPSKDKSGQKPKGKAGADVHKLFDVLREAKNWTEDEVDAHIAGLEAQISKGDLTPDQEAAKRMEASLVDQVGNWKNADAERRATAVKNATEAYEKGYYAFQIEKSKLADARNAIKDTLGIDTQKSGNAIERKKRLLADNGIGGWWNSVKGAANRFTLNMLNFEQALKWTFGEDSEEATAIADAEREASHQKEDAIQNEVDQIDDLFTKLASGDKKPTTFLERQEARYKGTQLRYKLAQPSFEANGLPMSEMEGIAATLMWKQEDGRRHMEGHLDDAGKPVGEWHYGQDFIDQIEANLSPEAKAVRDYLIERYSKEWETLNPVFRELEGIDLPRHESYSPISVVPQQVQGQTNDPITGQATSSASSTPSSLRSRSGRIAEPDFRDALQTRIAHVKQIEHYKAYAGFARNAQAIIGNRELGNKIQSSSGEEGLRVLRDWVDFFAQGGTRDAAAYLAVNKAIGAAANRAATIALVGKIGTLMIQSTQLGAAAAEMPAGEYIKRAGKLLAGGLGWKQAFENSYIQRRMQELPPVVRQAVDGVKSEEPRIWKHSVSDLGRLLGGADAIFTAGTFAIVKDYQMKQAEDIGLSGAEAEQYAQKIAERVTDRLAQPTRPGARSIFENRSTNPIMRLVWAFASDARKNLALATYAVANRPTEIKVGALLYVFALNGLMSEIIRSAWRDATDDGDDEDTFDERNWNLKRMGISLATGPFSGAPVVGDMAEASLNSLLGEYSTQGNLFSSLPKAFASVRNIDDTLAGERSADEILRDVTNILSGVGLLSSDIAAAASLANLARQLYGLGDNAIPDEE